MIITRALCIHDIAYRPVNFLLYRNSVVNIDSSEKAAWWSEDLALSRERFIIAGLQECCESHYRRRPPV